MNSWEIKELASWGFGLGEFRWRFGDLSWASTGVSNYTIEGFKIWLQNNNHSNNNKSSPEPNYCLAIAITANLRCLLSDS